MQYLLWQQSCCHPRPHRLRSYGNRFCRRRFRPPSPTPTRTPPVFQIAQSHRRPPDIFWGHYPCRQHPTLNARTPRVPAGIHYKAWSLPYCTQHSMVGAPRCGHLVQLLYPHIWVAILYLALQLDTDHGSRRFSHVKSSLLRATSAKNFRIPRELP